MRLQKSSIDGLGKRSAGFIDRDIEQTETASAGYPGSRDHDHFQMGSCPQVKSTVPIILSQPGVHPPRFQFKVYLME
jgi:hypothetical protein